jgi:hypothetical protein
MTTSSAVGSAQFVLSHEATHNAVTFLLERRARGKVGSLLFKTTHIALAKLGGVKDFNLLDEMGGCFKERHC